MIDLNTAWFILVGVLLTGYAILDGFDLGVGSLHLLTRTDQDRRLMLNAIGPVWDGNEVWLVTGGGALFAAFPEAYATAFSGFYEAMILLLVGLIFRAVAIEFRSKRDCPVWRRFWDASFSVSSVVNALLIGVALGNIAHGIPLNEAHVFTGTFVSLLNPYALLVGLTTVALFMMHGAIYLVMKTEGELQARIRGWVNRTILVFVIMYVITTVATFIAAPHMVDKFKEHPWLAVVPLFNVLVIANIPREISRGREMRAFLSSCLSIAALMTLFGLGMYPYLILAEPVANSLDLYFAASSQLTLKIMLIVAGIGMPLVLSYTVCIYWIFRGKVKLNEYSY